MKSKTIIVFYLLFSCPGLSYGQETISRIEKLRIGAIHTSFSFSGTSFGSEIWGKFSNGKYYPWLTVFENPAFVSGERRPRILLQFAPSQSYGLTRISDISRLFNDELDNAIHDYRAEGLQVQHPTMNVNLKKRIQWPEGMILFPVEKLTLGLLFHRPMNLQMNFDILGTESSISTELNTGGGSNRVVLNNYLDGTVGIDYLATSTSLFASTILKNRWIAGFQLERIFLRLNVKTMLNIQGSMYFNGKEYLFNDPQTLWPTEIIQSLFADYSGSAWRVNWGSLFVVRSNLILDGAFGFVSDVRLEGRLHGERNKIPALNIDALRSGGGVDEILDAEKLNPSQLTLTESIGWQEHPYLLHTLPNYFKAGILYRIRKWMLYFSDRVYFGSYRLQYGEDYMEIDPKHQVKFYLSRGGFFTRFSGLWLGYHTPARQDFSTTLSTILPFLSLGYARTIFRQNVCVGSLELLPVPGVNIGVQYQF